MPARSTGGRPLALPEPARDGDAAYEPEWHGEPAAGEQWTGDLVSPFAAAPEVVVPEDWNTTTTPRPVDLTVHLVCPRCHLRTDQPKVDHRAWAPQDLDAAGGDGPATRPDATAFGLTGAEPSELAGPIAGLDMHELAGTAAGSSGGGLLTEVTEAVDRLLAPFEGEDGSSLVGQLRDFAARLAVRNALDHGERREKILADLGFAARHPSRPPGLIRKDDPRYAELRADWIDVLNRIVRPALREAAAKLDRLVRRAARPSPRLCCLLWTNVLDPGNIGNQGDSTEKLGEVFTRKLGFIDLGHARETADVTLWALTQLQDAGGAANSEIELFNGEARLLRDIPVERRLPLARQLAYVDAVGHEIDTWGLSAPGGDNSSFSPEDLTSNLLGTLVAAAAFASDGGTNAAITSELDRMLQDADAQPAQAGRMAQAVAKQRGWWVEDGGTPAWWPLRKRNFRAVPWLIDDQGGARIGHAPLLVEPPLASADFEYTSAGKHVMSSQFQATINGFRSHLQSSALVP